MDVSSGKFFSDGRFSRNFCEATCMDVFAEDTSWTFFRDFFPGDVLPKDGFSEDIFTAYTDTNRIT